MLIRSRHVDRPRAGGVVLRRFLLPARRSPSCAAVPRAGGHPRIADWLQRPNPATYRVRARHRVRARRLVRRGRIGPRRRAGNLRSRPRVSHPWDASLLWDAGIPWDASHL